MERGDKMMRYVTKILLKGIGAVLPVVLTLYLVYWLGVSLEKTLRPVIGLVLPDGYYRPGTGLVLGLLLLFLVGLLVDAWIVRRLFRAGETLLEKIPLVKSVYGALRDFTAYFSRMQENRELQRVVWVQIAGCRLLGFITGSEASPFPGGKSEQGSLVAVYLPMSYQIGGFTVYVPGDAVEPLDIPAEEAMKLILTAGLSGRRTGDRK
jgi:uncharacterized membrane protein